MLLLEKKYIYINLPDVVAWSRPGACGGGGAAAAAAAAAAAGRRRLGRRFGGGGGHGRAGRSLVDGRVPLGLVARRRVLALVLARAATCRLAPKRKQTESLEIFLKI